MVIKKSFAVMGAISHWGLCSFLCRTVNMLYPLCGNSECNISIDLKFLIHSLNVTQEFNLFKGRLKGQYLVNKLKNNFQILQKDNLGSNKTHEIRLL